jgi:hypothetical protein
MWLHRHFQTVYKEKERVITKQKNNDNSEI